MTETKIKKYYLGELGETEANALEEELALSAELTETAQIVEDELIYDYLQGGLSDTDRANFEKNYLTTPARLEKLRSAQIFLKNVQEKPVEVVAVESQTSFWQSIFANWNISKSLAFGALAVLVLGGISLVWLNRTASNQLVQTTPTPTPTQIAPEKSPTPNDSNFNQPTNQNIEPKSSKPTPTTQPSISPTPKITEPIKPTLATFTLLPGTLRSNGEQSVKIASETAKVNLNLSLPKDAAKYQTYQAILKTADGETVATFSNLKSLNLTLPANKLSNKTYIVFLEGISAGKSGESVAEYTFRVRR